MSKIALYLISVFFVIACVPKTTSLRPTSNSAWAALDCRHLAALDFPLPEALRNPADSIGACLKSSWPEASGKRLVACREIVTQQECTSWLSDEESRCATGLFYGGYGCGHFGKLVDFVSEGPTGILAPQPLATPE